MDDAAPAEIDAARSDAARSDASDTLDGGAPDAGPLRVLFIGNSYTSYNDLPGMVRALGAATPGATVEVDSVLRDGAYLTDHVLATGARERIANGGFGAVVFQGQSLETLTDPFGFSISAGQLAETARDAGTGIVWFATWARRPADASDEAVRASERMGTEIERVYQEAASTNGGVVARVGAAWRIALKEQPGVVLYLDDGSHPSPAGTLLSACVLLQALTGRTPRLPDRLPLDLDSETANALCGIAPRVLCNEGMGVCDGACVELASDPNRCGGCDVVCPGVEPCQAGVCGCSDGLTPCGRVACVDVQSDEANCGGCDDVCPSGGVCERGSCVCPDAVAHTLTPSTVLSDLRPGCTSITDGDVGECSAAVHAFCRERDCFQSGFGPAPVPGHAWSAVCVGGDVRRTTFTELSAFVPECDGIAERIGPSCSNAISRFCASMGAASGFGPVDIAGDELTITCLPRASIVHTTFEMLAAFSGGACDATAERFGPPCSMASSFVCSSMGHLSGFGPVEISGSDVDVVCVDP